MMGGRHFEQYNAEPPECIVKMGAQVPRCFKPDHWVAYLKDTWRASLGDNQERQRLHRGQVPDYCADCTQQHRRRMLAVGRCAPPAGAAPPALEQTGG